MKPKTAEEIFVKTEEKTCLSIIKPNNGSYGTHVSYIKPITAYVFSREELLKFSEELIRFDCDNRHKDILENIDEFLNSKLK